MTSINDIQEDDISELFKEFADVFDGTLGKYKGNPISFNLDPKVSPIRIKP